MKWQTSPLFCETLNISHYIEGIFINSVGKVETKVIFSSHSHYVKIILKEVKMKRRKARECALKILYMYEMRQENIEAIIDEFWKESPEKNEEVKEFATILAKGAVNNIKIIDKKISEVALNWQIERMSTIDRNILRIGSFEIMFLPEIPPAVSINEAIELAKKYGTEDSPKFVNGILHKIKEKTEQEGKNG